ncbi:MAG: hypothetical protein ACKN9I_02705 [Alphaproteobacteria bacterium]
MKNFFAIMSLIALTSCFIGSGENSKILNLGEKKFPKLTGIDLNGNKKLLPESFVGNLNIVAIGFEREHQEAINTWISVADEIIEKNPEIKFYEVPLIYELSTFSRAWVNNGMRFGIQNEIARKRTITVYTNRDEFFNIMQMKGDRIYVAITTNEGDVLWLAEGIATKEKTESLQKFIKDFETKKLNPKKTKK